MTKSELIRVIHDQTDFNFTEIEDIFDLIFQEIIEGLKKEDKVLISGFGTFEKYYQEGYTGVNPSTGEPIEVPGSFKIRFNTSRKMKEELKDSIK